VASQVLHEAAERTKGDEGNEAIAVHRPTDRRRTAAKSMAAWQSYAYLGSTEIRELCQLREKKAKLKRLVADLSLDKNPLAEFVRGKI
jgi:hypothetical protein